MGVAQPTAKTAQRVMPVIAPVISLAALDRSLRRFGLDFTVYS
jgi:hypothetical protein